MKTRLVYNETTGWTEQAESTSEVATINTNPLARILMEIAAQGDEDIKAIESEPQFEVFEVGFSIGVYPTFEAAKKAAKRCYEYAYIVNTKTQERYDYGGPVSG